jgi:26S proteasome regulatory subunit N6
LYSLPQELAELIRSSRPFMLTIAKAKTAKLSKRKENRKKLQM